MKSVKSRLGRTQVRAAAQPGGDALDSRIPRGRPVARRVWRHSTISAAEARREILGSIHRLLTSHASNDTTSVHTIQSDQEAECGRKPCAVRRPKRRRLPCTTPMARSCGTAAVTQDALTGAGEARTRPMAPARIARSAAGTTAAMWPSGRTTHTSPGFALRMWARLP
jgi:hypothetical protein